MKSNVHFDSMFMNERQFISHFESVRKEAMVIDRFKIFELF